uniref:Uncharacterized protein n=1 Tax=Arundo donax TaxID=35708 RepID=A0A0A8XYF8_ARUDO
MKKVEVKYHYLRINYETLQY